MEADIALAAREALALTLAIAAPPLLAALALGLLVSLIQALTQINETSLVFIPKFMAVGTALFLAGAWMLERLGGFARSLFDRAMGVGLT